MTEPLGQHYTGQGGVAYLQQRQGALADRVQSLRASLFSDLNTQDKTVLDFGCGAGGVLSRLAARRRIGIEIGENAARLARESGLEVFATLEDIPSASIDTVISFHALEHVEQPLSVLGHLNRVVKPNGRIRLIVPAELPYHRNQRSWRPNTDQHLFTWTPLHFGNLAARAGMTGIQTKLQPMPSRAGFLRAVQAVPMIHNAASFAFSWYRNVFNTVLDAEPGFSKENA